MLKFRTKVRSSLLFIFFLLAAVSLILNIFFHIMKNGIAHKTSLFITQRAKIQNIFFLLPNTLILTNVTLHPEENSSAQPMLTVPLIMLKISPIELFLRHQISISTIVLNAPQGTINDLLKFLSKNANYFLALLQELPRTDFDFILREARLFSLAPAPHNVNFYISIRGNEFLGKGTWEDFTNPKSLQLNFNGNLTSRGLILNQCILQNDQLYSNLWGDIQNNILQLYGYVFLGIPAHKQSSSMVQKLFYQDIAVRGRNQKSFVDIIDINCRARMIFSKFQIDHLKFNFNDFPVMVKGTALLSLPPTENITASLDNAPPGARRIKNFKQANLSLSGALEHGIFRARGGLNLTFEQARQAGFPLEEITADSEQISLYYDRNKRLTMESRDGEIVFTTPEDDHRISFKNIKTSVNLGGDKFKIIDLAATLYGGNLHGRVWADVSQTPAQVSANATFSDLDANSLAEMLIYFSKIQGRLSGKMNLKSHPNFSLNGEALIIDGNLQNFDFFNWMAETFHIPSLTHISFTDAFTQFWLSAHGNGLTDISLNSNDVKLTGYFSVDNSSLVASQLSLSLSREILQESPKFRAILKMFEQDIPFLNFDFQLSGSQNAMNFQWLQSEFKQRIQDRTPNFIERMIDRRIDAILEREGEEKQ